ncbi:MAG: AAA family ATPase [Phycisphaerae bacterium]
MARGIRAIILNMDEDYAVELRSKFLGIDGLKIVAELDEPGLFDTAIKQCPADLLIINLDQDAEGLIQFGAQIAEKYPELTLFAVSATDNPHLILQAMRSGFREFLVHPIEDTHLAEALNRITRLNVGSQEAGKLICVLGAVGGCGATTLATNLACELSQVAKRSAVIVDLDLYFGHVATLLDLNPQFSLADLCQTLDSMDHDLVEKALIKHETGLRVLARPGHFSQAQQISLANVSTILNSLCGMFDYVICDGPMRSDIVKPGILDLADQAVLVLNLTVPAVRNVDRILQELVREGYNLERTRLIVSRCSTDHQMLSIDDVEQTLSRNISATLPEEEKVINMAINAGQPLLRCAPKSKIRELIKDMAMKIHDPSACELVEKNTSGGLFARMLGR